MSTDTTGTTDQGDQQGTTTTDQAAATGATGTEETPTLEQLTARAAAAEKEAEKWRALSRKNEERATANAAAAKELDKVKQSQMTEQERAVNDARADERAKVLGEVGARFVDAEFRVAAAGRTVNGKPVDLDAVLEGVNRNAFLNEDGEVDTVKVLRFIDGIAPKQDDSQQDPQRDQFLTDLGQGKRTSGKQSTADQFATAVQGFLR